MARHKWWVLGAWIVVLVVAGLSYPHLMSNLSAPDYSVTGSDSEEVADLIWKDFTAIGAEQDIVVFDSAKLKTTDTEYKDAVGRVVKALKDHKDVVAVISPYDPGADAQISTGQDAPPSPRSASTGPTGSAPSCRRTFRTWSSRPWARRRSRRT